MKMKISVAVFPMLLALMLMTACGGGDNVGGTATTTAAPTTTTAAPTTTTAPATTTTTTTTTLPLPAGSTAVNGCQEITKGGRYVLQANIDMNAGGACIAIHDASGVDLDCANHAVTSSYPLSIRNAKNFSVKNCTLQASTPFDVSINDSSNGTVSGNTIAVIGGKTSSSVSVSDTDHLVFDNNVVFGLFSQYYGNSNTISNNRMTGVAGTVAGALVWSERGSHTKISGNLLDGQSKGKIGNQDGVDDGVVLWDEADATVENNVIQQVFDCGVETVGTITAASIRGNRITGAGFCGIGGWYWNSLVGSTIAQNIVEKSTTLFQFRRSRGLRPAGWDFPHHRFPADTAVMFKDNLFDGNVYLGSEEYEGYLTDITLFDNLSYVGIANTYPYPIEGEREATMWEFQLSNNVFKNNQFGRTQYAPMFGFNEPVPGMVIDGGGNVCKTPLFNSNYALHCN